MDRRNESLSYRAWTFLRYRVVGAMKDYIRCKRHLLGSTQYHQLPRLGSLAVSSSVDGRATPLGDTVPDTHADLLTDAINLDSFEVILQRCKPNERVLLRRLFISGETKTAIAEERGLHPSAISMQTTRAIERIRETMKGE